MGGGNVNFNDATNKCEVYDIAHEKWDPLPSMNEKKLSVSLLNMV